MADTEVAMTYLDHPDTSTMEFAAAVLPLALPPPATAGGIGGAAAPGNRQPIIADETEWRRLPLETGGGIGAHIVATRWQSAAGNVYESPAGDWFILGIALQRMDIRLAIDGEVIRDGFAWRGMHYLTAPGACATGHFRGPSDWLHIHIPPAFVDECAGAAGGGDSLALRSDTRLHREQSVERLATALLDSDELAVSFGRAYADCIATALAGRLVASAASRCGADRDSRASGLMKWRLKRAVDFVEERLAEPLSLADIAAAAGLSRMYFAAQFRASTGLRPREYVLRRRVERAQRMLLESDTPIVEIALDVGFQSQAHFTGVFKRFVGQPPHAWRQAQQ
jgi:AraC family transcriptional regulator